MNDLAIQGGWKKGFTPADAEGSPFSSYVSPLLDRAFWEGVCVSKGKAPEHAKLMMVSFAGLLYETGSIEEALGKLN